MSVGPIPGSKIREEAEKVGITYPTFRRIIRSMDGEYLSHVSEKQAEP